MKRYLIAPLFAVLALLCTPLWAADSMSVAQLKQDMQAGKGPIIIDVREEDEYLAGHIPGAIMVPAKQMEHHLDMMEQYRKEQIVLYCVVRAPCQCSRHRAGERRFQACETAARGLSRLESRTISIDWPAKAPPVTPKRLWNKDILIP